jgi:diguanylate cyclase
MYLHQVGEVLSTVPNAMAFRFGGDEFCMLFSNCYGEQVEAACRSVKERFLRTEACLKYEPMSLSFGIAPYYKGLSCSELVSHADEALYRAKENRGDICFYIQKEEVKKEYAADRSPVS